MAKNKRMNREAVMQILFVLEAQGALNTASNVNFDGLDFHSLVADFINSFYERDKFSLNIKEIALLLKESLLNLKSIDEEISKKSESWRIERMNAIDRAILRMSMAEMMQNLAPKAVVINEAVEIAKRFGTEKSYTFINGILGNF